MYHKTPGSSAISKPHFKVRGIDSNKRLTKIFRESLNRSWVHPYIRARRFVRDYSLPVGMTVIFLLVVGIAAFLRVSQRTSLANLLAGVTNIGQDYGTLFSNDKTDELKKNTDNTEPTPGAPARAQTSFAINTNTGGTSSSQGSTGTSPGNNSPPTGGGGTPAPVFGAAITSFQQDSATLECTTPKPNLQTCSKRYVFGAGVRTQNGPGTVNYGWRSSLQGAAEDGSFSVGNGDAQTSLQKVVILDCRDASNFNMQLVILSPTSTQSAVINVSHNCLGI